MRKIASHGHLVANHTMTHKNLCRNPTEAAAEIDDAVAFARKSPFPARTELSRHMFA